MAVFEVPLSPINQYFTIFLNGIQYQITLQWRDCTDGGWFMDIADSSSNPIISGVPLTTGLNLMDQYEYLGITGAIFVQTDGDIYAVPDFTNLGITAHLYYAA